MSYLYVPPVLYQQTVCPFVFETSAYLESVQMIFPCTNGDTKTRHAFVYDQDKLDDTVRDLSKYNSGIFESNGNKRFTGCVMSLNFYKDFSGSGTGARMEALNNIVRTMNTLNLMLDNSEYGTSTRNLYFVYVPRQKPPVNSMSLIFNFEDRPPVQLTDISVRSSNDYNTTIEAILGGWHEWTGVNFEARHLQDVDEKLQMNLSVHDNRTVNIIRRATKSLTSVVYSPNKEVELTPPVHHPIENGKLLIQSGINYLNQGVKMFRYSVLFTSAHASRVYAVHHCTEESTSDNFTEGLQAMETEGWGLDDGTQWDAHEPMLMTYDTYWRDIDEAIGKMDWSSSDDDEVESLNMEDLDSTPTVSENLGSSNTVSEEYIEELQRAIAGQGSSLDFGIDSPSQFSPSPYGSPNAYSPPGSPNL